MYRPTLNRTNNNLILVIQIFDLFGLIFDIRQHFLAIRVGERIRVRDKHFRTFLELELEVELSIVLFILKILSMKVTNVVACYSLSQLPSIPYL